ncbi:MAG: S41 family peptidase [Bacteroidales bacterium]|nr:S41 family peptidase [Bacteroidales bacterium]MDZ4203311.1 S41 family peptidase [Bacteroidales bacterium]
MKNNSRYIIYFPIIVAVAIIAGMYLGSRLISTSMLNQKFNSILPLSRYDKVNDVIQYILRNYVDSVEKGKLEKDAVIGILKNLDPHSQYIDVQDFNEVNDPLLGAFEGIGIQFRMERDSCTVIQTIVGGPSEKAGIKAGDRIVTINDSPVAGLMINDREIVKKLKGEKGSKVIVGVFRRGNSGLINFPIIRDVIPTFSIDVAFMADRETGYIKLSKFAATTHQELLSAIETLSGQGMQKLIFDLRGNSGGYLQAAIKVADEFLDHKQLIVYTEGVNRPRQYAYASSKGIFKQKPLVVLIDEGSASASEIIAGAIQDNDRGLIIGRRSFGKGLVQEQLNLHDGSAIRLTIARYYTPAGRSIQKPYENGAEEYFHEPYYRVLNGEMENADSIRFNDSLKYTTAGGRIVYGGGGIMPDVFIPIATDKKLWYFDEVASKGLIYQFAFDYTDENRDNLSRYKNVEDYINNFHITPEMLRNFVLFAERNGVKKNEAGFNYARHRIDELVKAFIARNFFNDIGFYQIYLPSDNAFSKAVETLRNWDQTSPLATIQQPIQQ